MSEQKKSFDDLDAVKILVETLGKFNELEISRIIRWSCERLGIQNVSSFNKTSGDNQNFNSTQTIHEENQNSSVKKDRPLDIKSFVNSKKPASDSQFVAVVAYYFKFEAPENQKKDFIVSEDLNEAARLADRNRFSKPAATLNNVYSKSGFLDRIESGKYVLNTVGENLVAMVLPGGDGGKVSDKISRKKRAKKIKVSKKKNKK